LEKTLIRQIQYSIWNPLRFVFNTTEPSEAYIKRDPSWMALSKSINQANQKITKLQCYQTKNKEIVEGLHGQLKTLSKDQEQRATNIQKHKKQLEEIDKQIETVEDEILNVLKSLQVGDDAAIAFLDTIRITYTLINVMELQNITFRQWSSGLKKMKSRIDTINEAIDIDIVRNKVKRDLNQLISQIQKIDYVCCQYTKHCRLKKEEEIREKEQQILDKQKLEQQICEQKKLELEQQKLKQQNQEIERNNGWWTKLFGQNVKRMF